MMFKRPTWLLILTLLAALIACSMLYLMPKPLLMLENIIQDSMFIVRGEKPKDTRVVIVDIDEKSLKQLGQWPWSRQILAKILDNLTQAEVAAIGMDMIFAEDDRSSPHRVVANLNLKLPQQLPNFDAIFAHSIQQAPVVTGFMFALNPDGVPPDRDPRSKAIVIEKNKPQNSFLPRAYRPILNIPSIEKSSYSSGFLNNVPDFDGVVRSVPSVVEYDHVLYPSLSIELLRLTMGVNKIQVQYNDRGVEFVRLGNHIIPTDIYGHIRVNYTGHTPAYQYISATDVYHKRVNKQQLASKIVLFGTSSAGLYDLRSSPFDIILPGVEVHANLIDNVLNQNFIAKPQWSMSVDYLSILSLALFAFITLLSKRILVSVIASISFLALILISHYVLMFHFGIIFNSVILILEVVLLYFLGTVINYLFEYRQKERIKDKFAKKVSKEVMEDIVSASDDVMLKVDTKDISIFFSDIRGFTRISENMPTPQQLIEFLNAYMTPMTEIIIEHKGTVDKFIGDAIMAYWNAPKPLEKHADFALQAAIAQIEALKELNQYFKAQGWPAINIGIGLNSGSCIVGEMGSKGRSDYTCIGDSVNLASRLEGLNKKYATNIILSEFFLQSLHNPEDYDIQELGEETVKGKNQSVLIFTCSGYRSGKKSS